MALVRLCSLFTILCLTLFLLYKVYDSRGSVFETLYIVAAGYGVFLTLDRLAEYAKQTLAEEEGK